MQSEINNQLTENEKVVLELYKNPKNSDIKKQIRLSIQYAIGAGIFLGLTIFLKEPLYSIGIFVIFILFLLVRINGAKKISGIMPRIIEKYENAINDLKNIE